MDLVPLATCGAFPVSMEMMSRRFIAETEINTSESLGYVFNFCEACVNAASHRSLPVKKLALPSWIVKLSI